VKIGPTVKVIFQSVMFEADNTPKVPSVVIVPIADILPVVSLMLTLYWPVTAI
jgi:hypothetical protein